MAMRAREKKVDPKLVHITAMQQIGKRFYFETQNGIHISVRARNGLLAVKAFPSWVLL